MATELEQLKKELEKCDERRKELNEKLRRRDIGMGERALTSMALDDIDERKCELLRLIKAQEDGAKHDELIAEAQRLMAERITLGLEMKDKSGDEKEAAEKKVAELTEAIAKALEDAEELAGTYDDNGGDFEEGEDYCTCGNCGECGYSYSYDHLARANGYNSY